MTPRKTSLEHALEEAVSRALRDNLAPLQRTADELHHAYGDLVAACGSSRPSNALPALLRAQTAAAALAAGLSVLSNFVAVALNSARAKFFRRSGARQVIVGGRRGAGRSARGTAARETARAICGSLRNLRKSKKRQRRPPRNLRPSLNWNGWKSLKKYLNVAPETAAAPPAAPPVEEVGRGRLSTLPVCPEKSRNLHRRANRVAKVAMQDIKLLQPKEVRLGREHKDICVRLRVDIDKARKEYDRRFRAIQDHPVDYFYDWMVEILADGDPKALGEYPYPSPVLRH